MSAIAVDHLTKRFGKVTAVDDLSFEVRAGSVTGFLGPNGAGKTTTLRVLLGLAEADAGRALIHGEPYQALGFPAATVGAALERSGFHPGRSGRNHLRWIAAAVGLPRRRADEVLALVDMTEAADRRVGGYSMGMRQRLALGAALLGEPEVLVLDEPANGLDPQGMRWLREFLREQAAAGRTVLVSSHVLAEVAQTVDDVVVIDRGRLIDAGPVAEVTRHGDGGVRVRSPDALALAGALERAGARVAPVNGEELRVEGLTAAEVGDVALEQRVPVHGLAEEQASLEEVFLRLTGGEEAPA